MLPFPLLWYDPCTSGRSDVEIRYVLRFPLPIFMILSTVVPVNDLLSEPPTRKACIVVGHSAGAPATLPRCPRWSVLALAARHRNVRTERKQSVIPHVYMFADVVASVHLIMHPRATSAYLSASRGITLVRRVFPRHAPMVLCLLCFHSSLDADPAPLGMNPLVSIQMARKPNLVSKRRST